MVFFPKTKAPAQVGVGVKVLVGVKVAVFRGVKVGVRVGVRVKVAVGPDGVEVGGGVLAPQYTTVPADPATATGLEPLPAAPPVTVVDPVKVKLLV